MFPAPPCSTCNPTQLCCLPCARVPSTHTASTSHTAPGAWSVLESRRCMPCPSPAPRSNRCGGAGRPPAPTPYNSRLSLCSQHSDIPSLGIIFQAAGQHSRFHSPARRGQQLLWPKSTGAGPRAWRRRPRLQPGGHGPNSAQPALRGLRCLPPRRVLATALRRGSPPTPGAGRFLSLFAPPAFAPPLGGPAGGS